MLRTGDYEAASVFLQRLYAQHDPETFPTFVVREVLPLVGGDQATWNEMALSVSWARVIPYPTQTDGEHIARLFAEHMHEHPGIRAWEKEGTAGVRAISDFLTSSQYRCTRIYQHLYRSLGYEDQLALALTPPGGHALALAFGRGAYGVTKRDKAMAEFLIPHIRQAWYNVQALFRAERAVAGHRQVAAALGQAVIELDEDGRVLDCPPAAAEWLRCYFPAELLHDATHLPATLAAWARQCAGYDGSGGQEPPLVRRCGHRRLTVRYFPMGGRAALLALEERTGRTGAQAMQRAGLTRREIEVLVELETGKTNAEIAASLSISAGTVKKHLDNIYAKLGVSNRTEAVVRLRRA